MVKFTNFFGCRNNFLARKTAFAFFVSYVHFKKNVHYFANFGAAFANPLPSFHPVDLLIGVAGGALLKLAVYIKGKNRKKFRQGEEYGSARWGRPEDIRPYMDDDFSNNVILT